MDIESLNEGDLTLCDRCFQFWGYKFPLGFLCIFVICMFTMAIVISEANK